MDKQRVIMMVGIPGAGKTHWAQKWLEVGVGDVIVSSDSIRKELFGDESFQGDNKKVFEEYYSRLVSYLREGKNVILDATNISLKDRKFTFDCLKNNRLDVDIIAHVINTPFEVIKEQNQKRDRVVPDEVLEKFLQRYQHPQKFEGFTKIVLCQNATKADYQAIQLLRDKMDNFKQLNHHHIYNLGEHCERVGEYFYNFEDTPSGELVPFFNAGWWHDVGKLFTQTFDENGEAHYYNHAQVGTYYLVSHPELLADLSPAHFQEVLFYVNYHMLAHEWKAAGGSTKYRKIFGDELYNNLMEFATADRIACGT